MKKLMFALACAASAAVMGDTTETTALQTTADFEEFAVDTTAKTLVEKDDDNTGNGTMYWALAKGSENLDASVVTEYGASDDKKDKSGSKYLKLETNGDELQRRVAVNEGEAVPTPVGDGLYIDTLVQFTATPEAPTTIDAGAKLAIWLEGEDTYTLKVLGGVYYMPDGAQIPSVTQGVYTVSGTYSPDTWYRLTVKAVGSITKTGYFPGFQIYIDGNLVGTEELCYDDAAMDRLDTLGDETKLLSLTGNKFVPVALATAISASTPPTLTCVGFQGSGAIDNVEITDVDPLGVTPVEFTLTINFADGVNAVSYTVDNVTKSLTSSGPVKIVQDKTVSIAVTEVADSDWFDIPETATTVVMDADNKAVTVTATPAFKVNVPDGTAAETVSAALVWAKNAGKETTDVAGAANLLNNYLLNVTELDVEPQIKIVEIDTTTTPVTVKAEVTDEEGTTIKTLTTEGNNKINASIKYKAAPTLEALKTVQPKESIGDNDQFIQVVVE